MKEHSSTLCTDQIKYPYTYGRQWISNPIVLKSHEARLYHSGETMVYCPHCSQVTRSE